MKTRSVTICVIVMIGFFSSPALAAKLFSWGGSTTLPDSDLTDITAIAAGYNHNLALKNDGSIVAWGRDDYGQATPPAGNDFVAIAAGGVMYSHSLALKSDGSIVCWGRNNHGQVTPQSGNDFIAVSAGGYHSEVRRQYRLLGGGQRRPGQWHPHR